MIRLGIDTVSLQCTKHVLAGRTPDSTDMCCAVLLLLHADLSSTALTYCSRGNYGLAVNAAAAYMQAQQAQQNQHWKMIVARVPLGRQTDGRHGLTATPEGYDSVNSGSRGLIGAGALPGSLYCHVVFDNDQAYPEYVITLKSAVI